MSFVNNSPGKEDAVMNRTVKIALFVLLGLGILAGIAPQTGNVMFADGSDPMPLCRHGHPPPVCPSLTPR